MVLKGFQGISGVLSGYQMFQEFSVVVSGSQGFSGVLKSSQWFSSLSVVLKFLSGSQEF